MQTFQRNGAPSRKVKDWNGRFWRLWADRFVPMGNKVLVAAPGFTNPMTDASELEIHSRTGGRIALAGGFASHGEPASCVRAKSGRITALKLGGSTLYPAPKVARKMEGRYGKTRANGGDDEQISLTVHLARNFKSSRLNKAEIE